MNLKLVLFNYVTSTISGDGHIRWAIMRSKIIPLFSSWSACQIHLPNNFNPIP